jgi:hypothetical protein
MLRFTDMNPLAQDMPQWDDILANVVQRCL